MMEGVVNSPEGTGGPAKITDFGQSVVVGGKTGTADVGDHQRQQAGAGRLVHRVRPRAGQPAIAVAVLIENGGVQGNETTGGLAAGPVAKKVMTAYLKSAGVS